MYVKSLTHTFCPTHAPDVLGPSRVRSLTRPPHAGDWVQNAATATTKWLSIGDWDVSDVKDFSWAFSKDRDAGGTYQSGKNAKAASFVGAALSKWKTNSATSFAYTFYGAGEMNSNLSGWSVGKVVTLDKTFRDAFKFAGDGLNSWITTSLTDLYGTFEGAREMNSNLSGWRVAKVTTLANMFHAASKFAGEGLESWDTTSVTTLARTFEAAYKMDADLSGWQVDKVTKMWCTFFVASKFRYGLTFSFHIHYILHFRGLFLHRHTMRCPQRK